MVLEMLAGGGLTVVGFLIGRFAPARRRFPKPPEPICGCDHPLAYHNPKTGICGGEEKQYAVWDATARRHVDKMVRCTGQQYDGPTPLPTMYAPEIST